MQVDDNLNRLQSLLFATELAAERKDFSSAQICSLRPTVPLDLSSTMLSSALFSAKPSPSSVRLNVLMESKGGKKSSSCKSYSTKHLSDIYNIEDVQPNGGIKKFRSAAYSNCALKPS
ncbi:putative S-adenosyl-l-methionine decarboxylase leader peptide [Rosa chinensis]|uniref:Putative S-adenosyl-l-methionine decarboxylase leader peptide n=1 Tax=Rosa chinensis TaxID=74649 RepID=A0A2P6SG24_ROSCH|nr:putative S-adenosyl-l-methionine decarboxylase leader peptide [Rosa chinensis]